MSVSNEQNQDSLISDVRVDSDKAHPSEVHEHADFENEIEENHSAKDETNRGSQGKCPDTKEVLELLAPERSSLENTDNEKQCYICDEIGHKANECQFYIKTPGSNVKCFNCNEMGHKILECPLRENDNNLVREHIRQEKKNMQCNFCLKPGHTIMNCRFKKKSESITTFKNKIKRNKCNVCSGIGHNGYECPTKKKQDQKRKCKCYKCGVSGHKISECRYLVDTDKEPKNEGDQPKCIRNYNCHNCGVFGHKISECPLLVDTDKDASNEGDQPKCFLCKSTKHDTLKCPMEEKEDNSEYSSLAELSEDIDEGSLDNDESKIKCALCNNTGHTSDECKSKIKKSVENLKKRVASKALLDEGQELHPFKKMRPQGVDDKEDTLMKTVYCYICATVGHRSNKCPNKKKGGVMKAADGNHCYKCGEHGHKAFKCPLKKTLSDRSRSRSPLQRLLNAQSNVSGNRNFLNPDCLYLFVGNIPQNWNINKIKQFYAERCKSNALIQAMKYITIIKDTNNKSKGECIMEFTSSNACLLAMKALRGADVEGKKIIAMPDTDVILGLTKTENSTDTRNTPSRQPPPTINPEPKSNNNNTYGLSVAFLESLNIKPPLRNKIFVANLDSKVTESGLRELFSHAGQVVTVLLNKKPDGKNNAKIEFDHPVEAVQAISMFHNRMYFGEYMLVQIDKKPSKKIVLPPGLSSMGPGLGPNGKPLRGIRHVVELEPIKQMLIQELSKIQSLKMKEVKEETKNMTNEVPPQTDPSADLVNNMNYQNAATGMNNPFGWMGQSGLGLLSQMQNLQGLLQPNLGFATSITDLQAQFTPNVTQNFMPMAQQMNAPQSQMNWTQNQVEVPQNQMNWTQNQVEVPQNQMNWPQNQVEVPQNQKNLPQSQVNVAQNHYNAAQNQMTMQSNQTMAQNHYMNVPQNQMSSSSQLANMTPSQLINMSQNQLADLPNSQVSQSWSAGQTEWSTQHASQSQAVGKDKNDYRDSTFSESSKYNKATTSRHSDSGGRKSEEKSAMTSTDMLVFKNLPRSVTEKALKNKMREVGELRYVEITGEGRAIVRFNEAQDAALCYKLFDRSKVDGQTISVNYF